MSLLRLYVGLGHVHRGILRGEIVFVNIPGLLGLPALPHQRGKAVFGNVGERSRCFRLLKRGLHLVKPHAGLGKLIVHLGGGDDGKETGRLHAAADVHHTLRDVTALAGINRGGVEGLRGGGQVILPGRIHRLHLLNPKLRHAILARFKLGPRRLIPLKPGIRAIGDQAANRRENRKRGQGDGELAAAVEREFLRLATAALRPPWLTARHWRGRKGAAGR